MARLANCNIIVGNMGPDGKSQGNNYSHCTYDVEALGYNCVNQWAFCVVNGRVQEQADYVLTYTEIASPRSGASYHVLDTTKPLQLPLMNSDIRCGARDSKGNLVVLPRAFYLNFTNAPLVPADFLHSYSEGRLSCFCILN
jgi:hypothetical protein